ncbi:MAG TPA: glutamine amidotransferase, partial [Rhodospirillales bacterium]|nr:glutamine amidotransferase [Rhodospirillales bacterium]
MKTAVAIRHVAFEDLGTFEPVLAAAGYTMRYLEAADDELSVPGAAADAELLVILGGPIGAYEEQSYPFLADELRLLESRVAAGRPLLGICLGAQIIARGLGA